MKREMNPSTASGVKSEAKPDMITGVSSAVGATIGVVGGSVFASHAAESPLQPLSHPILDTEPAPNPNPRFDSQPDPVPDPAPDPVPDPAPDPAPNPADPEIVVLRYETIANEDGSLSEVAELNVDGQTALLIDTDLDGTADILAADVNGDGHYDANEQIQVGADGISMTPFQAEIMEDSHALVADSDYVNDADVDEYMA